MLVPNCRLTSVEKKRCETKPLSYACLILRPTHRLTSVECRASSSKDVKITVWTVAGGRESKVGMGCLYCLFILFQKEMAKVGNLNQYELKPEGEKVLKQVNCGR